MCTHNDVASDYEEEALWEDHHSGLGLFTFWGYLVIFLILSTAVHPGQRYSVPGLAGYLIPDF
jgi:hypothetical protein